MDDIELKVLDVIKVGDCILCENVNVCAGDGTVTESQLVLVGVISGYLALSLWSMPWRVSYCPPPSAQDCQHQQASFCSIVKTENVSKTILTRHENTDS